MNDQQKLIRNIFITIFIWIATSTVAFFAGYYSGRADTEKHDPDNPGMQSIADREAAYLVTINKLQALLGQQQMAVIYIEKAIERVESNNSAIEKANHVLTAAALRGYSSLEKIRKAASDTYYLAGSLEVGGSSE